MLKFYTSLITFFVLSTANSNCLDWFNKLNIARGSANCTLDCSLGSVDMSSFSCPNYCDKFCSIEINISKECKMNQTELSCSFYDNCLESNYNCGESGYPLKYGKKYCKKFLELQQSDGANQDNELSEQGIRWRNSTLLCLQDHLAKELESNSTKLTCNSIKEIAFNSHADCYTQPNYSICDLPRSDIKTIIFLPESEDIFAIESIIQSFEVGIRCLSSWTGLNFQNINSLKIDIINPYEINSVYQEKVSIFSEIIESNKKQIVNSSLSGSKKKLALKQLEQIRNVYSEIYDLNLINDKEKNKLKNEKLLNLRRIINKLKKQIS